MHLLKSYEQTAVRDEYDPGQRVRLAYVPGGYQSFYFNPVADAGALNGLGSWGTLPAWAQVGVIAAVSTAIGYFGMKKFGNSHVKPALRKVGINLSGPRRRRRR